MGDKKWMPLYIGEFLGKTMDLGATETGIYIRLIMHCWEHGYIPRDERKLAIISHCDTRLWHQYRSSILKFFDVVDASTMHNKRVTTELARYQEISNVRKARALQQHSKSSARAVHMHTQLQSHKNNSSTSSESEKDDSDPKGSSDGRAKFEPSDRLKANNAEWIEKLNRKGDYH